MEVWTNVKINLGLNVLRKRPDGYHDLETVFVPYFGMGDLLCIEPSEETSIEIGGPTYTGWDPQKDLTLKAYSLLKEEFGIPAVKISLQKNSPVGAGLGGGSSDAVEALKMLDTMFGLNFGPDRLKGFAAQLGSDCPFFVDNAPRFASGRGEILEETDVDLSSYEIRVTVPEGISVSTREAYAGIRPHMPGMPLKEVLKRPVAEWKELLHNDFEDTVFPLHPQLADLKEQLYSDGAVYAAMSGSGSALFGLFRK